MRKATKKTKHVRRAKPEPVTRPRTELDNARADMERAKVRLQNAATAANLEDRRKAGYAKVHSITVTFPDEVTPGGAAALINRLLTLARDITITHKNVWDLATMIPANTVLDAVVAKKQ